MNVEAILNDLETAQKAMKDAQIALAFAQRERAELVREAKAAGVSGTVIGRLCGVSRQRVYQLMEV